VNPAELSLELVETTRKRYPPEPKAWLPSAPPPEELASALGRWWSEGSEYVFRWHEGRLEARWAEAPAWHPWARFEPLDADRLRTVFGRERGELLRLVRDSDGNVTRMYWATYPLSREPEVTGLGPSSAFR
jgi:hypothetical protein